MSTIATTPKPPYYAVIFSSLRSDDIDGYEETAARMVELAAQQPGFLGVESAREEHHRFLLGGPGFDQALEKPCRAPGGAENGHG